MSAAASSHQFADASTAQIPGLLSDHVTLEIRQQPESARVAVGKEKGESGSEGTPLGGEHQVANQTPDRKPVDPPPIVQMTVSENHDPNFNFLQSPYIFMSVVLVPTKIAEGSTPTNLGAALAGTLVSSLHRLKDATNRDGAFFVFGDLSVKIEGRFQLQFNLYEMRRSECFHIKSILSDIFTVHATKHFPGMSESTFLTRSFSDQGVRLRLRKEPRTLLRKRGPASEDYVPRHYNKAGGSGRSIQGDAPVKGESSQQSQGELAPSMHPMESPSLEQRPPVGRGYSFQSNDSYSTSFSEEPSIKRPRTGSEHSHPQSFGQQPPTASPQYQQRMFPDSQQQSPYIYTQPSQPTYGGYYTQSPQSATSSRDAGYGRYPIQQSNVASYNTIPQQRSPQSFYPPQQQTFHSPQQFSMPQMGVPTPPQRINTSLGMMDRPQLSPTMGEPSMVAPPVYGRMQSNYTTFVSPIEDRREGYDNLYQTQGGLAVGMGAGHFIPRTSSGSINTTSGPGMEQYH